MYVCVVDHRTNDQSLESCGAVCLLVLCCFRSFSQQQQQRDDKADKGFPQIQKELNIGSIASYMECAVEEWAEKAQEQKEAAVRYTCRVGSLAESYVAAGGSCCVRGWLVLGQRDVFYDVMCFAGGDVNVRLGPYCDTVFLVARVYAYWWRSCLCS